MVTEKLKEHLKSPLSISIGTSSKGLIPNYARGFGAITNLEEFKLNVLIPKIVFTISQENLKENKNIAVNFTNLINYFTLQCKGKVLEIREANEEENKHIIEQHKKSMEPISMYFEESFVKGWGKYKLTPALSVIMHISEIYDQTPGKMAGMRLL